MNSRRSLAHFALLGLVGLVFGGCAARNSGGTDAPSSVEQADSTDSSDSSGQASHFGAMFTGGVASAEPAAAASTAGTNPGLYPAGCVTRKVDPTNPRVVDLTFDNCTGPFGLVALSGSMTATFSSNADGSLHIDLQSANLTANGHPVTHSGSGDVHVNRTTRNVTWHGDWTRVNRAGETVAHTTSLSIAIDSSTKCRDVNGTAQTTIGAREVDSTIKDYKVCGGALGTDACPSGEVTLVHKASGRTITVDFDGSDKAILTGPRGGTIDVPLVCAQ